eukprot:1364512-Prymnesium_polylepis.1
MEHRANLATAIAKCEDNVKAVEKACAESIKAVETKYTAVASDAFRTADQAIADAKTMLEERQAEMAAHVASVERACAKKNKEAEEKRQAGITDALRDADDRVADAKIKLKEREEKVEGVEKLMHTFRQEAKKEAQEEANIEIRKAEQEAKAAIAAMTAAEAK